MLMGGGGLTPDRDADLPPAMFASTPSGDSTGCTIVSGLPSPTRFDVSTATRLVSRVTR
jgi:hypothetical protein